MRTKRFTRLPGLAFAILAFPVFQAYRAEVIGMRGISRAAAAADIGRSFELAMGAKKKVQQNISEDYRSPGFVERTALKPTLEMFMAETGKSVEFQGGYTLGLYFTGTVFYALQRGIYGTLPFLVLFQVGFLYTGLMSVFQQTGGDVLVKAPQIAGGK